MKATNIRTALDFANTLDRKEYQNLTHLLAVDCTLTRMEHQTSGRNEVIQFYRERESEIRTLFDEIQSSSRIESIDKAGKIQIIFTDRILMNGEICMTQRVEDLGFDDLSQVCTIHRSEITEEKVREFAARHQIAFQL